MGDEAISDATVAGAATVLTVAEQFERLKQLDLDAVRSRGYCFQEEILWHLKRQGAGFAETPIIFTDRTRGQSKCGPGEALAALWTIFRLGITNWIGL